MCSSLFVADSPVEGVKVTDGANLLQNLTLVNDDWVAERLECDPDGIVHALSGGDAAISIPNSSRCRARSKTLHAASSL